MVNRKVAWLAILSTSVGSAGLASAGEPQGAAQAAASTAITPEAERAATPAAENDANNTARAAELHPIVPSPRNALKPAFQLYAEVDLPLLGIGVVLAAARLVRYQTAFCAPLCDRSTLNSLDRATAGYWSPAWQTASNVGIYSLMAGSAAMLAFDEGGLDALNDGVVIAESALAAVAVASMVTLATNRPRPFLYGEKAPLSERNSPNGSLSYLSSHSAVSFAIATSSFMASRRLYPGSARQWYVLGVGTAMASFVAAARVMGGMHFMTDSLGGAVVGSSLGVLIPALHRSPVTVVPIAGETHRGLALAGRF
jgi:membrane-associated phospholipid phosphatase